MSAKTVLQTEMNATVKPTQQTTTSVLDFVSVDRRSEKMAQSPDSTIKNESERAIRMRGNLPFATPTAQT